MSRFCYFYATKEDILAVTGRVESAIAVKYVRFGASTKLPPECFNSAAQIPNLSLASHPSAVGCDKFLVCNSETAIRPRQLKTIIEDGVDRFAIDQLLNPDTVTFNAGGMWAREILLHGDVSTASQSEASEALMKRFRAAIKKDFTRVRAFYVGPQALELLKNGKRLTIAAQSPPEYNLTIP